MKLRGSLLTLSRGGLQMKGRVRVVSVSTRGEDVDGEERVEDGS
jgi:hypothetical protein